MEAIESENTKFEVFHEKPNGISAALAVTIRWFEIFGDLAAGAAEMAFPPSALVFGTVSYLMNAAKDVSASYDPILDLMERLKARSDPFIYRIFLVADPANSGSS
jgi:hypothetical protein